MKEEIRTIQQTLISFKGGFELTISEININKTYQQLRGFHRLIDILVPYFNEWDGQEWSSDDVKSYIKKRHGFSKSMKGIDVVRSCKGATKKEMMGLIQEVIMFASELDIPDVLLKESEARDLDKFYDN
jgi:hypothetical protein